MNTQQPTEKLWPILVTAMFASFMNPFMLAAVNIALPAIQTDFDCNATSLSWITNTFLLANAIVLLPASKAADLLGRVKFFRMGLYIFTLFTVFSALSPNLELLLVARVFQGAGAALMGVTGVALVTEAYPANKRGMAIGLNITAVYTGLSVGPFIGGLLTQLGGWPLIFWSVVPMGIFTILLSHFSFKQQHTPLSLKNFDIKGSILYALAIFAFVFGGGKIRTIPGIIICISGVFLMVYFFFFEKKNTSPILNVSLLKNNSSFTYANMAALIHYSATFGIGFLLSLYLQYAKGLSPRDAGLVLVVQPIIMAISAPLTGRMSDKMNPGILASVGLLFTLVGLTGLVFLDGASSIVYITLLLILLGLGFGFFTSPNTNAIMSAVEKKDYGIASGINGTMRVFGQTFSMMLVTIFMTVYLGKAKISPDTVDLFLKSMKISFVLFALFCLPAIWFSLQRNKN
jgi:EmrB/QacA subfamily drug resistance transporter